MQDQEAKNLKLKCSWSNTVIYRQDSDLIWITGCNKYGQLGLGSKEPEFRKDFQ